LNLIKTEGRRDMGIMDRASRVVEAIDPWKRKRDAEAAANERDAEAAAVIEERRRRYEVKPDEAYLRRCLETVKHGGINPLTAVVWELRGMTEELRVAARSTPTAEAWLTEGALVALEQRLLNMVDRAQKVAKKEQE
jgi:hypothetical protein